jgi:hypothetical protein
MVKCSIDAAKGMVVVAALMPKKGMMAIYYCYLRGYFLVMNLVVGLM